MKTILILSCFLTSICALAQNPPAPTGGADRNRPGPWDNDVLVYRVTPGGEPEKLAIRRSEIVGKVLPRHAVEVVSTTPEACSTTTIP